MVHYQKTILLILNKSCESCQKTLRVLRAPWFQFKESYEPIPQSP
jgi:arsenate reductase-like glutaredoxin family protein